MISKKPDAARLDKVVADARRAADTREQGYRERSLKMYPWICGRCMREFTHANVSQLTVHHVTCLVPFGHPGFRPGSNRPTI